MSVKSFQGAEIETLTQEFLSGGGSPTIVRDTSIKVTGVASWKLASNTSDFFETAKTKAATDVIAACLFDWRTNTLAPSTRVYRVCTAGDSGANAGRWYVGLNASKLHIYKSDGTLQASTSTTLSASTFYHIALFDDGTKGYIFINGVEEASWTHSQGAWNNKEWGPSAVQVAGKATAGLFWFDNICCFDDQDGRMDHLTPTGFRDGTDETWRVERPLAIADVDTGFTSTGGNHYTEVDEEPNSTSDYVYHPNANSRKFIIKEGASYYDLPAAGTKWGFTHDKSPADNEWSDAIFNTIKTGIEDTTDSVKETMGLETAANAGVAGVGTEKIRAVRYLFHQFVLSGDLVEYRFYVWRDTVLIGPDDPAAAGGRRRWHGGHF